MADERNESLAVRHMRTWGRAARAARHYLLMKEQRHEQDGQVLQEAKVVLITELAVLLEIAKQLDKVSPLWKQVFYVKAAQNMIAACGMTQQEIDDYQSLV